MKCGFEFERRVWCEGIRPVAGLDEAGRGPLAGPVTAGAVILPEGFSHAHLRDSKQLTEKQREAIYQELISDEQVIWSVASVSAEQVDALNILRASHCAMREALAALSVSPRHALIDGLAVKPFPIPQTAIVKGDALSLSIAAASVIAKVTRDRIMVRMHDIYPQYDFARHKGYPTRKHLQLLLEHGPCQIHRRSFRPVAQLLLPF